MPSPDNALQAAVFTRLTSYAPLAANTLAALEVRAKLKGRKLPKALRERLSSIHKERWARLPPEEKEQHVKNLRHHWSPESREKLSQTIRGRKRRPGSSPYVGVSYFKRDGNWRAYTKGEKGKKIHLGYFSSAEDAARAYNAAILPLAGEFARLNVLPE